MSDVMRALYDHLVADSGVTALVSTRVYRNVAPAKTPFPRVTLTLVSKAPNQLLQGAVSGYVISNAQIDSWGVTPDSATAVAEAVRLALQGFIGSMGTQSLRVHHATIGSETEQESEPDHADDVWTYRVMQDCRIIHQQPVPSLPA